MDDSLAGLQLLQKCKGLRKFANALPCFLISSFFLKKIQQPNLHLDQVQFSCHMFLDEKLFLADPPDATILEKSSPLPFTAAKTGTESISLQLQLFFKKKKLSLFSSSPLKTACILQNETSPHEMGIFRLSF